MPFKWKVYPCKKIFRVLQKTQCPHSPSSSSIRHLQPLRVWASSFLRLHEHTQGHTTVGRIPLDEWSARRRDLYLTTHTTLTSDKHPCHRRDSKPQSQEAMVRRPTPSTAPPLGSALCLHYKGKLLAHTFKTRKYPMQDNVKYLNVQNYGSWHCDFSMVKEHERWFAESNPYITESVYVTLRI